MLFEWLRGPRREEERAYQEALLPSGEAVPFGPREAIVADRLYGCLARPRGREFDLGVVACAMLHDAALWTLDARDFRDVPGLALHEPPAETQ